MVTNCAAEAGVPGLWQSASPSREVRAFLGQRLFDVVLDFSGRKIGAFAHPAGRLQG
jgi:hypothetical protein